MEIQYYIRRGAQITGPLSRKALEELAASGSIAPDDEIREEPVAWVRASELPGLGLAGNADNNQAASAVDAPEAEPSGSYARLPPRAIISHVQKTQRAQPPYLAAIVSLLSLLIIVVFAALVMLREQPPQLQPKPDEALAAVDNRIWESPTSGQPLDLKYIAPGTQAIAALRPAELLKNPEGDKLLDPRVLGPLADWVRQDLSKLAGTPLENIEQVLIGFLGDTLGPQRLALVVHLREPVAEPDLVAAWRPSADETICGQKFYHKDDLAFYAPPAARGRTVVVAPAAEMRDIIGCEGLVFVRLETDFMLRSSDADRHFTLIATPKFLSSDPGGMFVGVGARLKAGADWLLTGFEVDQPGAARQVGAGKAELPKVVLFSAHLSNDGLFAELRCFDGSAAPQLAAQAGALRDRLHKLPRKVSLGVQSLDWDADHRDVLVMFADMVRAVPELTRVGTDDRQVVVRTYLPLKAAHNLALATRACLLAKTKIARLAVAPVQEPRTAAESLQQKISLSFPRNTLEKSMQLMSEQIGVPITIIGGDLQLEGITKNQSFGLDEKDKPAVEIFVKILRQANPDGKLVYVFRPREGGGEDIFLTTRRAAERRGDKVPAELGPAPPQRQQPMQRDFRRPIEPAA